MVGLFISRFWFGFKNDVLDIFAYVFPVGMAIQRVGCLLAGCCFGTPTDVPWAVVYPRYTHPHAAHVNSGLLDYYSPCSLPVHPNPLYQIIACIIILVLLYYIFRRRMRFAGNLFLTSIALYLISRVITEFFRDASSNGYAGNTVLELKIVQWILIVIIIGLWIVVFVREKKGKHKTIQYEVRNSERRNALFFLALFILIISIWKWLPGIERLHIFSVSLALGAFSLLYGFKKLTAGKLQWSMIFVIPLSLFLISWVENDTLSVEKDKKDFISIGIGYIGGKYDYYYSDCPTGDCCNGPVEYHNCKAHYNVYGAGFSNTHFTEKGRTLLLGLNFSYGTQYERDSITNSDNERVVITDKTSNIYGLNPRLTYGDKYLGFGLGIHVGSYQFDQSYSFCPQLELRVGPTEYFYISGKLGEQFPGLTGRIPIKYELGSGFGTDNFILRAGLQSRHLLGLDLMNPYGFFIQPSISFFKNQLTLEGYYAFFPERFYDTTYDEAREYNKFGLNIWWNMHMK
jgi:hypothetical protein